MVRARGETTAAVSMNFFFGLLIVQREACLRLSTGRAQIAG